MILRPFRLFTFVMTLHLPFSFCIFFIQTHLNSSNFVKTWLNLAHLGSFSFISFFYKKEETFYKDISFLLHLLICPIIHPVIPPVIRPVICPVIHPIVCPVIHPAIHPGYPPSHPPSCPPSHLPSHLPDYLMVSYASQSNYPGHQVI